MLTLGAVGWACFQFTVSHIVLGLLLSYYVHAIYQTWVVWVELIEEEKIILLGKHVYGEHSI
jgi:Na+-translocating ferredoxin:NAD+ oxidoreductase RnfD subunit